MVPSDSLHDLMYEDLKSTLNPFTLSGNVFVSGSRETDVGLGQSLNLTIENPSNSKKRLLLEKFIVFAENDVSEFSKVFINPDTNLPGTTKVNRNQFLGHVRSSPAIVKADASGPSLSGGIPVEEMDYNLKAGKNEIELHMVVPAGFILGTAVGGDGVLSSNTLNLIVAWTQVDV